MWKKLVSLVRGNDCDVREKMLRTVILVGGLATVVGIFEIFAVMDKKKIIIPFACLMLITMLVCLFFTFKYRKYDFAAMLLGIVVIGIVFPVVFFVSGGIESGASIWLALGIMYTFVVFSGKKYWIFMALCLTVYAITYILAYTHPDMVIPMDSKFAVYADSFFSLVVVGFVSGIILKAHIKVFEAEHKINLAQKEELEKSSNAKNIFFANMSHEIRTPINTIIGLNEIILRADANDEISECAHDIQLASKMLLNQVNDILDLSQMEMTKMKAVPLEYNTKDLFSDLVELIRVRIEKKGLELYVDIDRNIPSVLYGDEKRLKQIFLNILDNAIKYTNEGSVTLAVQGEKTDDDKISLKVKVADTGIGIRKEDVDHIYDYFNRADERGNKKIGGSGLGLAITKHLVDLLGGEITVDSIYTKGSIFTVIFSQDVINAEPIGNIDLLNRGIVKRSAYKPSFESPEARVLVVDDNSMNSLVIKKLLAPTKVQVDIANSGSKCLELTKLKYYNVILMDYLMPELTGEETLNALRVQENGLCRESAVVVVTANTMTESRTDYLEKGFDGYVEKPVDGRLLENEIKRFLPEDIIEYQVYDVNELDTSEQQIQRLTGRKRKKVYITTDCTCDLPMEILAKYDIGLMYLYVRTPFGRFADTREIDSDSLSRYISPVSSIAYADGVTVSEYEDFFADTLTQAERVIHISMGVNCGISCNTAIAAAKGFDHVHIIDSGQISSGQGFVAIYAAKLAMEGKNVTEICELVEKFKKRIQTRFVMPRADIFYQNGRVRKFALMACRLLNLHPMVRMRQSKAVCTGLLGGSIEHAWRQGIRWHLKNKRKIDKGLVIITHVGCSVKQQEWIKNEVLKRVPFEHVIVQKASFTSACNSGIESIGISYCTL